MSDNCIFCRIAAGEMDAGIAYEDDEVVAFHDVNPQAPVHILVVPRRHIASHQELGDQDAALAGRLHLAARTLATQLGLAETGYRAVINCGRDGGQSVDHLHLHLLGGRRMLWPPWPDAEHVSAG